MMGDDVDKWASEIFEMVVKVASREYLAFVWGRGGREQGERERERRGEREERGGERGRERRGGERGEIG